MSLTSEISNDITSKIEKVLEDVQARIDFIDGGTEHGNKVIREQIAKLRTASDELKAAIEGVG